MKLIKTILLSTLFAVANVQAAEVNITTARGELNVSKHPAKIAVYDLAAVDSLDALGVKVGASIGESIDYLEDVLKKAKVVGTIFKPDIEALHAYKPDLVIVGGRTASKYADLQKYFKNTLDMSIDNSKLFADSLQRISDYGKLFDKQKEAQALVGKLNKLIDETKALAKNRGNGLILLVTGNKISAYGSKSRLGWIHGSLGVGEADKNIKASGHGQPVSFEYIKDLNPDWLFVLDRGAAIGKEGLAAATVLDNPLVATTTAWKKSQVVYFSPAAYLAQGGARQIEIDVARVKAAFSKK